LHVRILLAPHGTRGDIQPMLALAVALRRRRHDVSFVAPTNFAGWITGLGFLYEPDGVDVEAVLRSPGASLQSVRWQFRYIRKVLVPQLFSAVSRAAATARPDVIIGAGLQFAVSSVAEHRGIPSVAVVFQPCSIPSSDAPPPVVRAQTLPRWVNRLLWQLGTPFADALIRGPINRGRAELGLKSIAKPMKHIVGHLTIVAADRDLGPLPLDAPNGVVSTDAWILEEKNPLEPRLERFLDEGSPPIYFGLGSMVAENAAAVAPIALGAARAARARLVVAGGWAQLDRRLESSAHAIAVREAPHQTLFPRTAGVVHHGGAGTTTAAAAAGVPQLILPHVLDQFYWARRVERLGLGPTAIPIERLNQQGLVEAFTRLMNTESFRASAKALGASIAARNGADDAVRMLERLTGC
jgi:vancomycin aglycone glucosyltransferase